MIMNYVHSKAEAIHVFLYKYAENYSAILAFFGIQFHFQTLSVYTVGLFKFFGYTIELGSNQNELAMYFIKCLISALFALFVAVATHYIKKWLDKPVKKKKRRNNH